MASTESSLDKATTDSLKTPCTSRSSQWIKTPAGFTVRHQEPRTRRLIASTHRTNTRAVSTSESTSPDDTELGFEGLLKKTWKIHSISPLYKFKQNHVSLVKYGRSLDVAFSQSTTSNLNSPSKNSTKSYFSIYKGLNFHKDDSESVEIQVTQRNEMGHGYKVVLTAILACVDIDNSPVQAVDCSDFTHYPVVLVSGTKSHTEVLLNWLERHFDCRTAPLHLSDIDLRWMLVSCCSKITPVKTQPILLKYSLVGLCEGINTIDCKFDSGFCREFWEKLTSGTDMSTISEETVQAFVSGLQQHMEYTMPIYFSKLSLSEVGTPLAYVSHEGKLKLFSACGVYPALHNICAIATDRFNQISCIRK